MPSVINDIQRNRIELTEEQMSCLNYNGDKNLVIKGYAGAGKSIVLMAIANKYIEEYGPDAKRRVALFTFQNTLVDTTKQLLEANGRKSESITISTINSYVNSVYQELMKKNVVPRRTFPTQDREGKEKRLQNVARAIQNHASRNKPHRFHKLEANFWLDEFDWMKEMNVWTDNVDYYFSLPRAGRGGKVRMNTNDRIVAYELFMSYCDYLEYTKQADWIDQALYLVRYPERVEMSRRFDHVLIDEAQDLSLTYMMALKSFCIKDLTIAMDMNQKIYARVWRPKQLGIQASIKHLSRSMRTTRQIEALAEAIRSRNDIVLEEDDKMTRVIPDREGILPEIVHLDDMASERIYLIERIKKYMSEMPNMTIGIIGSTKNQRDMYGTWLATEGIEYEIVAPKSSYSIIKPGVKLVTSYSAKGLEFNCVIIPHFVEGAFPYVRKSGEEKSQENFDMTMRNLAYVSMTRAKNILIITYSGNNGSRYINDMRPELFKAVTPIEGTYYIEELEE